MHTSNESIQAVFLSVSAILVYICLECVFTQLRLTVWATLCALQIPVSYHITVKTTLPNAGCRLQPSSASGQLAFPSISYGEIFSLT